MDTPFTYVNNVLLQVSQLHFDWFRLISRLVLVQESHGSRLVQMSWISALWLKIFLLRQITVIICSVVLGFVWVCYKECV